MPTDDDQLPPGAPATAGRAVTVVAAVVLLVVVAGLLWVNRAQSPPSSDGPASVVTPSVSVAPTVVPSPSAPAPPPAPTAVPSSLCPLVTLAQPVTGLTFNIHGGLGGGGLNLTRIADEIIEWKPDIVLLQEVDRGRARTAGQDQARELGSRTGMHVAYGAAQAKPDGGTIGNAILSRHPISASTNIALPRAGGGENRALLHAVLEVQGTEVSVYSTHWDHRTGAARRAQSSATAAILAADTRPTLLGGDLNTIPGAPAIRRMRRAAGLKDAWRVGEGAGLTVPAGAPRRRIDFLLHDKQLTALQAVTLRSAISDHRAVWARFEVSEQLPCIEVGEQG